MLVIGIASASSALVRRSEFRVVQDVLEGMPEIGVSLWIGAAAFLLAYVALIPLEVVAIIAGAALGAVRGGLTALLGSIVAAVVGYAAGRMIGPARLARWMNRRSYRSVRQLGARGVLGMIVLRLASVASAGSIHLLCGAGRVPFTTYIVGTLIALTPMVAVLSGLGGLLRQALLTPSVSNAVVTAAATLLVIGAAAALRTFLLIRQFAPAVSLQRERAEFG